MLISTPPFLDVCRSMAELGGMPDQRWAVVEHPLGSTTDDELRSRAKDATDQFVAIVTGADRD
jgi:hypothetical protein